jgi:hypothetical protein
MRSVTFPPIPPLRKPAWNSFAQIPGKSQLQKNGVLASVIFYGVSTVLWRSIVVIGIYLVMAAPAGIARV